VPDIPAICDNCGTVFRSGFFFGVGASGQIIGSKSSPCPNCGGTGSIRDGFYQATSDTELLRASSGSELEELKRTLDDVRSGRVSAADAGRQLEQSATPAGRAIGQHLLANQGNRMELYTIITMLVAVIAVLLALRSPPKEEPAVPHVQVMVEQLIIIEEPNSESLLQQAIENCYGKSVIPPQH
jgi:hypothetical protein